MPILIIDVSLSGVSEYLVSFRGLFEVLLRFFTSWIAVWVVLEGKLSVTCLYLFGGGVSINAKNFVVVSLRDHHLSPERNLTPTNFALTNEFNNIMQSDRLSMEARGILFLGASTKTA